MKIEAAACALVQMAPAARQTGKTQNSLLRAGNSGRFATVLQTNNTGGRMQIL